MKNDPTDIKLYLQRQDKYFAKKFTKFMLGLLSPKLLVVSFMVIVLSAMYLITKPAEVGEVGQAFYHSCAIAIGVILGGYGFGALFFHCKLPKLKPLLSASYIQDLCNETIQAYDEMALPVEIPRSGINYLDDLIREGTPMNYSHENIVRELIEKDEKEQSLNSFSKKMALTNSH